LNQKILLISNMYPSKNDPTYGTFVHTFKIQMENEQFDMTQSALIRGSGKNAFEKIVKYIKFFKDVIILIRQNDYDLIYVHYIGHSLLPLLFVRNIIRKPLVLNAHGSDVLPTNRLKKYIQKLVTPIIKNANLIVVPSAYFQNIIHHKFQIEKNRIFISPSGGIDIDTFRPLDRKKNSSVFTIGYVSRIEEGKGWDILLKATKGLLKQGIKNFKVLLIGGGSKQAELIEMIENMCLDRYVDYIGKVPHKELINHYNKMDIFAFTTTMSESLGLVGLEAMACGVPVIGSDIGGLPSYIQNGYNGELYEAGNIHQLETILKKFICMDKKELQQYSIHALETVRAYDSKLISKYLRDALKNMIQP